MLNRFKQFLSAKKNGVDKMVKVWDFVNEVERNVNFDGCMESVYATGDYIELENGVWIKSMNDGRYYDENENAYSAAYEIVEKTDDDVFVNFVNRYYKL